MRSLDTAPSRALARPATVLALVGALAACAAPAATLRDDATDSAVTLDVVQRWRAELASFEARRVKGVDAGVYERVRVWLDRLEAGPDADVAALLGDAVRGELEVLTTAEQRFGASRRAAGGAP